MTLHQSRRIPGGMIWRITRSLVRLGLDLDVQAFLWMSKLSKLSL